MKKLLCCLMMTIFLLENALAQARNCDSPLDSLSTLNFAREKGLLFRNKGYSEEEITDTPFLQPKMKFNENKCQWQVTSVKYETTRKGHCKKVNGCTRVTTLIAIIDAKEKKILTKTKTKQLFPNYE